METTTGISAPPIGIIIKKPMINARIGLLAVLGLPYLTIF